MSGLIVGGDCQEGVDEIRTESGANNWILMGYNGKTNELKVMEKGDGGLEEFKESLNDGHIQFGYLRFAINQTFKYLFVSWCGGGVEGMRKGLFNNHTKDMENWLGKPGRGFHLQINARTEDDLEESIVLDKINKVSSFIKANSLKSAAKDQEQAKAQSSQYWQKEKQQDAARKEALSAHEQSKQQTLAAAKEQEQKRLGQQARATLSEMEQRRQADASDFQAKQQEITAAQAKLQEDKKAQIFADQQRNKAASYVPVDASHNGPNPNATSAPPRAVRAPPTSAAPTPAPAPAPKKAPGRLASPAAFNAPPPAAAPKPGPAKVFKPPAPAAAAPKPAAPKPAPPPAANKPTYAPPPPVYRAPEPEPEPEPAYEEPQQTYEPEPAYEEPQQTYEQTYEEPQQTYEQTYEEPQQTYEQTYEEQPQDQGQWEEQPAEQQYDASQGGGYAYPQAKALYDYAAEAETDLSFYEGDIINILEDQDPSGWWKGELNGAEGFFPSNFVELL